MAVKPLTGRQVDDRPVATDGAARTAALLAHLLWLRTRRD
jgi:hypothetical protein